jgi:hypothetical protein
MICDSSVTVGPVRHRVPRLDRPRYHARMVDDRWFPMLVVGASLVTVAAFVFVLFW